MRIRFLGALAALVVALAACSSSTPAPVVTETVTETMAPSPSSVTSPASARTIDGCTIEPKSDCEKADLHNANLRDAQLESSNFRDADLSGALLHRANLRSVIFRGADLSESNLGSAHLEYADLRDANLDYANLAYADLKGATITNATMEHAYLCGTIMSDGTTDDSGCETPSPAPSPSPHATKASITEFDLQATIHCKSGGGDYTQSVKVYYATTNAVKVKLSDVDASVQTFDPKKTSGTAYVNFDCPKKPLMGYTQSYTLTAIGSDGKSTTRTSTVTAKFKVN